jgi:conjugal transfer pilin signal peptidase TrbI
MLKELNLNLKQHSTKKLALMAIVLTLLVWSGMKIPSLISFSFTDSVGKKLFYYKKGTPETVKKGDFVVFPVSISPDLVPNCKPCRVTKIVGCEPGQYLKNEGPKFFCDGKYIGAAIKHSKKGVSVRQFTHNGIIPKNHFFAIGSKRDSYDSKYYGLVSQNIIQGTGIPLF